MFYPRLRYALLVAACLVFAACGSTSPVFPDQTGVPYSQTDLVVGTGPAAVAGNTVTVAYSLWLYKDSASDKKGTQLAANSQFPPFVLGAGRVIPGFDQGVTGMQVGGTRQFIVPPSLAYGATGDPTGTIPPNAALVFEVQLQAIQ